MFKLFIAFVICIVAVSGKTDLDRRLDELLKDASNACIRELNLDPKLINEKVDTTNPPVVDDPYFAACVDKKMGVLNDDATYNLERIVSFSNTPQERERAEHTYNTKIAECTKKAGGDTCKVAACVHKIPESLCVKKTD